MNNKDIIEYCTGKKSLTDAPQNEPVLKSLIELNFKTFKNITTKAKPGNAYIQRTGVKASVNISRFMAHDSNILFNHGNPSRVEAAYGRILTRMTVKDAAIVISAAKGELNMDEKEAMAYSPEFFDSPKKKKKKSHSRNELVSEGVLEDVVVTTDGLIGEIEDVEDDKGFEIV